MLPHKKKKKGNARTSRLEETSRVAYLSRQLSFSLPARLSLSPVIHHISPRNPLGHTIAAGCAQHRRDHPPPPPRAGIHAPPSMVRATPPGSSIQSWLRPHSNTNGLSSGFGRTPAPTGSPLASAALQHRGLSAAFGCTPAPTGSSDWLSPLFRIYTSNFQHRPSPRA